MNDLLHDLIGHMAWADAEHWKALEAHPGALDDDVIRMRLYHYHFTQWGFLTIIRGETLEIPRREELPDIPSLKKIVMRNHGNLATYLDNATAAELGRIITLPWFQNPPIIITVSQALAQVAMHSQYHRGQNAARFREIGGTPPTTDLVSWYWRGKPAAAWG